MANNTASAQSFFGWKNIALLFAAYFSGTGLIFYGFSAIFPVMIKALGWSRDTAAVAHSISVLVTGLTVPLVAIAINKLGARITMLFGFALLLITLLLMSSVMESLWQWIVLWGICCGMGLAFVGMLPIQTTVMHWFHVKRAAAIGITTTGTVLGGFIALPLFAWLMEAFGTWRVGWFCAALMSVAGFLAIYFVVDKPADIGQHADGIEPGSADSEMDMKSRARTYRSPVEWELQAVFRNRVIYFAVAAMVFHFIPLIMVTSHGVLHLTDMGFSQIQASSALSSALLGSAIVRFPAGWLADRVEPRWILVATFVLMMLALTGIWQATSMPLVLLSGLVFGICYGAQLILFPSLIGNYYGPSAFTNINGAIGPVLILFIAPVPVLSGYVFETYGSYDGVFIAMNIMLAVGILLSSMLSPPQVSQSVVEQAEGGLPESGSLS